MQIDLNSDVGESYGAWSLGQDDALIPLVTSVNIACGLHAGDPAVMTRTVRLALSAGVVVGAHPGYPDLQGFGRREIAMERADLQASIVYQIGALAGIAGAAGIQLRHVKPHGALYNRAAADAVVAEAVAEAVRAYPADLILVGLAGSVLLDVGRARGLPVAAEAFADRAYEPDGTLRSRRLPGAVLPRPADAAAQAVAIVRDGQVRAHGGETVTVRADTLCIHGDTPGAPQYARAVRRALEDAGVALAPLRTAP
ncbi:MAG: LamB/YcsF family protein [Chloroflexota bacterium]|nr:LamB/YcsF family protein [Chloroflexota bacterium]